MLVISNRPCASRSSDFEITRAITPLIKTIAKFLNVIGYQQPDLSINWTVAHVMLVIGQYALFCARCFGALYQVNCWVFQKSQRFKVVKRSINALFFSRIGNRTLCCPLQSVIILSLVINKSDSRFAVVRFC